MKYNKLISIIEGAGHVGFPLGLSFANKNFNVNLINLNLEKLDLIKKSDIIILGAQHKKYKKLKFPKRKKIIDVWEIY